MWRSKGPSMCSFSHITFLMNQVTCLNNIHEWSYKLPRSELEETIQTSLESNFVLWKIVTVWQNT